MMSSPPCLPGMDVSWAASPNVPLPSAAHAVPYGIDGVPGVLLHPPSWLRNRRTAYVTTDNAAVARVAFRHADNREATHQVTLTNNYYIGVFEVTQSQWDMIQPNRQAPSVFANPSDRAMRPVENVCYNEIRNNDGTSKTADTDHDWPERPHGSSFLGLLRNRTGIDDFDLPSESQWEFACRAGNGDTKWGDGTASRWRRRSSRCATSTTVASRIARSHADRSFLYAGCRKRTTTRPSRAYGRTGTLIRCTFSPMRRSFERRCPRNGIGRLTRRCGSA